MGRRWVDTEPPEVETDPVKPLSGRRVGQERIRSLSSKSKVSLTCRSDLSLVKD